MFLSKMTFRKHTTMMVQVTPIDWGEGEPPSPVEYDNAMKVGQTRPEYYIIPNKVSKKPASKKPASKKPANKIAAQ